MLQKRKGEEREREYIEKGRIKKNKNLKEKNHCQSWRVEILKGV